MLKRSTSMINTVNGNHRLLRGEWQAEYGNASTTGSADDLDVLAMIASGRSADDRLLVDELCRSLRNRGEYRPPGATTDRTRPITAT